MTAVPAAPARPRTGTRTGTGYRLTFHRALRSEWIKLATLRSTWWSVAVTAALTIGFSLAFAASITPFLDEMPGFNPIQIVVMPIQFSMLLAAILGAISVTGEYSTGMIRSTLTANPVRGSALAAKAVIVALLLFVSSLIMFAVSTLGVSLIMAPTDASIDWTDPSASFLPGLVASLTMAVFAVIGVAFGFLLRSSAGAISGAVGLLFVLPIVANIFSSFGPAWEWVAEASQYLPAAAAQSAILPGSGLDTPVAYLTLGAWGAAGLLAAWAVLRTRDA